MTILVLAVEPWFQVADGGPSAWLKLIRFDELLEATGLSGLLFAAVSLLVLLFELRNGAPVARFRSKAFMNDVLYSMFYRGGFYDVFLWTAVYGVLEPKLVFLQTGLLTDLPLYASIPAFWILSDFLFYWLHRLQHHVPVLWAFHSVHHSMREMSSLSQSRRHPIEQVVMRFSRIVPLAIVLGLPTGSWIPVAVMMQMLQALQHAELDWRFGPLYRVVVSPVFHSVHHSDQPHDFDSNYGIMFSVWDHLFGTASARRERPPRYGVRGLEVPESIAYQLVYPFRMIGRLVLRNKRAAPERRDRRVEM